MTGKELAPDNPEAGDQDTESLYGAGQDPSAAPADGDPEGELGDDDLPSGSTGPLLEG